MQNLINKNRNREAFTFANINLLGKCNANCYFCLGKDIENLLSKHNQINTHFSEWKNFNSFLNQCDNYNIKKLYITGQNTDSLLYKYLEELIDYLQNNKFTVGLRTNGYLAEQKLSIINKCKNSVGYSIHTLIPDTNIKIMQRCDLPNWENIIPKTNQPRIAIVINRYNSDEFFKLLTYLSKFENIKYIQVRRISTDSRIKQMTPDILAYEKLYNYINSNFPIQRRFYTAECYNLLNKETVFWRTVQTSINSMNYFTDGTISNKYFIVEGYLDNCQKTK